MKKNVLFIVIDCLRSDRIFGQHRYAKTPQVDKLKENGFNFPNTISTSTSTGPCFASIMTGLYPFNHGLREMSSRKLRSNVRTIGEIFKEAGYSTYAEVSGPLSELYGFSRGFDEYNDRKPSENLHSPWYKNFLDRFEVGHYKEPWILFFHIWDLHQPRMVDVRFNKSDYGESLYDRSISSIDSKLGDLFKLNEDNLIVLTGDHGEKMAGSFMEESIDRLKQYYYPFIRWKYPKLHEIFNRGFWKTLNLRGIKKGEFSATHGFQLYRYLITTPLIFSGPEIIKSYDDRIIRHIDLLPTIVDYILSQDTDSFDGISLFDNKVEEYAYSELFLDNTIEKEKWLVSLTSRDYQYIYQPYGSIDNLYNKDGETKQDKLKKNMHQILCSINPEIYKGLKDYRFKDERQRVKDTIAKLSKKF